MARPPGSKNVRGTLTVSEMLRSWGCNPVKEMYEQMQRVTAPMDKFNCAKELAKYCHPQLRAIELTGADGSPLISQIEIILVKPDGSKG